MDYKIWLDEKLNFKLIKQISKNMKEIKEYKKIVGVN